MTQNQAENYEIDVISFLKAEYTRTFKCSRCGSEESCEPAIRPDGEEGFVAIYGSGVDNCTHCDKWREPFEETSDFPADYDESEGEFTNGNHVQAEAQG